MRKTVLLLALALIAFLPSSGFAADDSAAPAPKTAASGKFTAAQRAEIENIIKEFLVNEHPEVLGMGLQVLQKRDQEQSEAQTQKKVAVEKDRLFYDPLSPVAGNKKSGVVVVEFYDYQCGYCKASEDAVERVLKEGKDVRFVFKNYPILGPVSLEAAKAAMAAVKQDKFLVFHEALMNKKEHLTSDMIYQVAKDAGLDVDKLKKDMAEKSVTDAVDDSMKLGQDIGVRGTPFFVINEAAYPGVLQYDQLAKAIDDARAKVK
jgi:protein-disulfide isomerase